MVISKRRKIYKNVPKHGSKRALICGISGQDGAYLAKLLLDKGYEVIGTSRDASMSSFKNLVQLGIFHYVTVLSMAPNDFRSTLQVVDYVWPDEIYNLAGQSSVGLSFEQPVETLESISIGSLNLLETIRFLEIPARFYNAGSGECFGNIDGAAADEKTPFRPRSPYAVAKAAAFWEVVNYRESYGLYASSGILFNHESPLRPERFVTRKIVASACRISRGSGEMLRLGNLEIERDWGWAPDYVDAIWRILQHKIADDFVIATGKTFSLHEFISATFEAYGLDWRDHVVSDPSLLRPSDIMTVRANPTKARDVLGWQARYDMNDVVKMMVQAENLHRERKEM